MLKRPSTMGAEINRIRRLLPIMYQVGRWRHWATRAYADGARREMTDEPHTPQVALRTMAWPLLLFFMSIDEREKSRSKTASKVQMDWRPLQEAPWGPREGGSESVRSAADGQRKGPSRCLQSSLLVFQQTRSPHQVDERHQSKQRSKGKIEQLYLPLSL